MSQDKKNNKNKNKKTNPTNKKKSLKQKNKNTIKKQTKINKKKQNGGFGNELKETDINKFKDSLKLTSNDPEVDELENKASSSPNYPGKFPVPDCSIM